MPAITLTVGGLTKSLAEWRVTGARLRLSSAQTDTLNLETAEALNVAPQWSKDDEVSVQSGGTVVFRGTIVPPRTVATASKRKRSYSIAGAGWWLEQLAFRQPWAEWPLDTQSPPNPITYTNWVRGVLFAPRNPEQPAVPDGLSAKGTAIAISDALDRVIAAFGGGAKIAKGTIDADLQMPPTSVTNATCAAVVANCLKRCFDAAGWWDYSAGVPAFHARRYEDLETVTLKADGTAGAASQVEVQELWETRLRGVKIVMKRQTPRKVVPDVVGQWQVASINDPIVKFSTDYPVITSGDVSNPFGVFEAAVDYVPGFDVADAQAAADFIVAAANNIAWRGLVIVPGDQPLFAVRPGVKINITGQLAAYTTMNALAQEVEHDLSRGTTVVRVGPAQHLDFQTLQEWMRWWNTKGVRREEMDERDTGDTTSENYGFGKGEDAKKKPGYSARNFDFLTLQGTKSITLDVAGDPVDVEPNFLPKELGYCDGETDKTGKFMVKELP